MNKQHFLNFEGDNFFKRNIDNINNINKNDDIIINNLNKIANLKNSTNLNILEIGCSNGWRLNELTKILPNNLYFGIDPSVEAIKFGKHNFNNIKFNKTTCDDMSFYENEKFDVILVPFVFMYIDRNLLIKSIFEIDRVLKNNGTLIITDFYSNRQRKNIYKHIESTFIYKQNYFEIFLSTKNYFLKQLDSFTHNTSNNSDNYDDICFYVELKKDLFNLFD